VVLQSIGTVGNYLLRNQGKGGWKGKLKLLKSIDWSRANAQLWEGRAMIGGRVSKSASSVTLTTSAIKTALGLELTENERHHEEALQKK
jgi:DNA sulfur modification protein DndB